MFELECGEMKRVNAWYSGAKVAKNTFHIMSFKKKFK
jgi:hypothetical protein